MTTQEITLSPEQEDAARKAEAWLEAFPKVDRPFFVLEGFAGTGKSFSINTIIKRLGLRPQFMAYTGKAALVLNRYNLGLNACTIHSAIYRLRQVHDSVFQKLYKELEETLSSDEKERLKKEIEELQKPKFELNEEAFGNDIDLIVLDECSMVDDDVLKDLVSFGLPIIALGDPGQLPPIGGEGALFKGLPDARLTEIRRQALDNPIIKWSMFAREMRPLPSAYDTDWREDRAVRVPVQQVLSDEKLMWEMFQRHDVVICWKNVTRVKLNQFARKNLHFHDKDPVYPVVGDTLIITKNDKELGIFNGQFCKVIEKKRDLEHFIEYMVEAEGMEEPIKLNLMKVTFEEYHDKNAKDNYRPWHYRGTHQADFGYAITCHKAQGSQWDNVLVFEENVFNWPDKYTERARWLYTAITRAAQKVTIVMGKV